MKGGQVAEPKLTTRGRSDEPKSRRRHSSPFRILAAVGTLITLLRLLLHGGPSGNFTTLELGASQPSFTYGDTQGTRQRDERIRMDEDVFTVIPEHVVHGRGLNEESYLVQVNSNNTIKKANNETQLKKKLSPDDCLLELISWEWRWVVGHRTYRSMPVA